MLKNKTKPIFVFDGPSPIEKRDEQNKRSSRRDGTKEKIHKMEELLDALNKEEKTLQEGIDEYQELTIKSRDGKIDNNATMEQLKKTIQYKKHKLTNQTTSVSKKDSDLIRELLDIFGINYIDAKGEADALCSYLRINNIVDVVISDDNDFLAYGVTSLVSGLDVNTGSCTSVNYKTILEDLEYDSSQFLDFCILCGTDYNSNIFRVGPTKSYKLITDHKNIETIVEQTKYTEKDVSILKHLRVREMYLDFPYILQEERDCMEKLNIKDVTVDVINWNELQKYLFTHNCMYNESVVRRELGYTNTKLGYTTGKLI